MLKFKHVITVILVVALGTLLRLWQLGSIPIGLFGDEVDTGYQAYSILQTGKDYFGNAWPVHFQSFGDWRVPLYIYFDTFFVNILGLNELAVRLPAALLGVLGIIATYFLAKKITEDKIVALIAALFLTISPWHLQFSRLGTEVILLSVLFPLGLLLFWKAMESKKLIWYSFSAILFGLTVYAYNTPKLFLPLILLAIILLWKETLLKQKGKFIVFILTLFIVMLPLGLDILKGTGQARFLNISIFNDPEVAEKVRLAREGCEQSALVAKLLHNKLTFWLDAFTKNYLTSVSSEYLFLQGDPNPRHSVGGRGELYLFELPLLLLGLFQAFVYAFRKKSRYWQFALLWLVLAPLPAALTTSGGNHAIRLFLFLPWLQIISALGLVYLWQINSQKLYRLSFLFIASLLIFVSTSLFLHQYFDHYSKNTSRWWNYGYREVFSYVNQVEPKYNDIYVSSSWEPSIVYTLFYNKYPPKDAQKLLTINSVGLGKFHFLSPDINKLKRGEGSGKSLYVLNPDELKVNNMDLNNSQNLKLIKEITAPDGLPAFVIFSSSDIN